MLLKYSPVQVVQKMWALKMRQLQLNSFCGVSVTPISTKTLSSVVTACVLQWCPWLGPADNLVVTCCKTYGVDGLTLQEGT
jgi:hypothetical protein